MSPVTSIHAVAAKLGITEEFLEPRGSAMAKLRLQLLESPRPATKRKILTIGGQRDASGLCMYGLQ